MFKDLLAPNTYLSMEGDIIIALKVENEWLCQQGLSIKTVKKLTVQEFDFF